EAVVEHALSFGTVVPMKLFTLFASDERAVAHVAKLKKALDRSVAKIEGCDEWGLRILFDEAEAARLAVAAARRSARPATGTSFLLRKKEQDEARRTTTARGAEDVDALFAAVSKIAKKAERRAAPSRELAGRVMLD